jgi:hypothetical protein
MRRRRFRSSLSAPLLVLGLAACAPPEVAQVPISDQARAALPPRLAETAQFDAALAGAQPDAERLEADAATLAARATALRARAAALGAPVVDPAARPRLEAGITVPAD